MPLETMAPRLVPAVDRAARMLDVLSRNGRDWSLTELAREIGIHKGTARDILLTLWRHGLVERDAVNGRYRLGLGVVRFARAALDRLDLREVAWPFLEKLLTATGETVLLGVRDGHHVVVVGVARPAGELHMAASIGQRLPLYAGSFGKAFLAEPGAFEAYLETGGDLSPYTERSQTDVDAYAAELYVVRARGYALDDGEYLDGVRAASAVVRGPTGGATGAVTVVGFKSRISLETLEAIGQACRATAEQISARLGGANLRAPIAEPSL